MLFNVTLLILRQTLNASSPIDFIVLGKMIGLSILQYAKASLSIVSSPSLNVTFSRYEQS
jgi:hypothetical protein